MVAILLSTYNGAAYLGEQIDSIIAQDCPDWHLYIRDDGSTDNTVATVKEYLSDPRITLMNDTERHRGCTGSFLWMLANVDADAYMFCDQDDVWLPEKISVTLEAMRKHGADMPVLVATDLRVVDGSLQPLHESMWRAYGLDRIVDDSRYLGLTSIYTACTCMLNSAARAQVLEFKSDGDLLHDQIAAYAVHRAGGVIVALHRPTILYRQHQGNTVGFNPMASIFKKILSPLKVFRKNAANYRQSHKYLGTTLPEYLSLKFRYLTSK